jgi:hypothetical protein
MRRGIGKREISQKVAGSRPDVVNNFFSIYLTFPAAFQPGVYSTYNRNEYQQQRSIEWPVRRADNFTAIYELIVWTVWDPQHLTTL